MRLRRLQDWPALLFAYIQARQDEPWRWGEHDCATFAAGAVEAMTGAALIGWRGEYVDARGAVRALQSREWAGPAGFCEDLGLTEINPASALRGDLVLLPGEVFAEDEKHPNHRRTALAVCVGPNAAVADERGYLLAPMSAAARAWAVGWAPKDIHRSHPSPLRGGGPGGAV